MATILDQIIAMKVKEVAQLKEVNHICNHVEKPKTSFVAKLEKAKEISIIAEFKRASPSRGDINVNLDPLEQSMRYVEAGADAVSILTDSSFFKGSFKDLELVGNDIDQPILCKEFIIDPIQIDMAHRFGADIILLIAAVLDDSNLKRLYEHALEKDLEVLMEVHNEIEAERVLKTGNRLIGVNNRNLKTFDVDLGVTEKVIPFIKKAGAFAISESGIKTAHDVLRVVEAGASGILVGEAFMRHRDIFSAFKEMKLSLKEVNE